MKKNDKKQQIKIIKIILIVIWMVVIFSFSNQGGTKSSNTSQKVTKVIIDMVGNNSKAQNEQFIANLEKVIRKLAHYSIYTVGGILIMSYSYTLDKPRRQQVCESLIFGAFYAVTDELHQFFVPGRSARFFDIGIDTLGVFTGIGIYIVLRKCIERISRNDTEELKTKI